MINIRQLVLIALLSLTGLTLGCDKKLSEKRSLPPVGSAIQSLSACLQLYVARNNGELPEKLTELTSIADELHVSGVIEFPQTQRGHEDWVYWGLPRKLKDRSSKDLLVAAPFALYLNERGAVTDQPESTKASPFRYCINSLWEIVMIPEDDFQRYRNTSDTAKQRSGR